MTEPALEDKYRLERGRAYMTGIHALVRVALDQSRADRARGWRTAGFVTGYRGSPLGGFDLQLRAAKAHLDAAQTQLWEAVNEELAATACQGTQQAELDGLGSHEGVFALWYGKGPGVDRAGDALKHGNLMGSSAKGGVLCLLGDDHLCESSTTAHQSEYACVDALIPVLNPSDVGEILRFGRIGLEMSRYSGAWVALKCIHDTVESAAVVDLEPIATAEPEDDPRPASGLSIRWPDPPLDQERRLHREKLPTAVAFARANGVDRVTIAADAPALVVLSTGKSHADLILALEALGIEEADAAALGLRVAKLGLVWPIDRAFLKEAALGAPALLVVEEKRPLIEDQAKAALYGVEGAPVIIGKRDENGAPLFPSHGALDALTIAVALAERLTAAAEEEDGARAKRARALDLAGKAQRLRALDPSAAAPAPLARTPFFCPGCPHNRSTMVPEGSVARAGIGCHYLGQFMERKNERHTQMGGEGASWIGEGRFTTREHVFQNMGDGTYYHSGALAVRAAIAAKSTITFKILYNDAVAMTGGQAMDGPMTPGALARQLAAEGVGDIAVVTDDPEKYPRDYGWPDNARVFHRDDYDAVQKRLRGIKGVSAILYDQMCAAEKRRRRKRGTLETPKTRVYIEPSICEGCGDCGVRSNCLAIQPLETPFGRKRQIDQANCNFDYSCVKGFCPSFVTLEGDDAGPAPAEAAAEAPSEALRAPPSDDLPDPAPAAFDGVHATLIAGVGGTGVITIGSILGMAAHLDGLEVKSIDQTGLAQKGGPVATHVKVAPRGFTIGAPKIARGGADLLLGPDLVAASGAPIVKALASTRSRAVIDRGVASPPGSFTRTPDLAFPEAALRARLERATGGRLDAFEAGALAARLFDDPSAANVVLLGYAAQKGVLPVRYAALKRAFALNGRAVARNHAALEWGRIAAAAPERLPRAAAANAEDEDADQSLDALIERWAAHLEAYADDAIWAKRYREAVGAARAAEGRATPGSERYARAFAFTLMRLMSPKDEYEVARLMVESPLVARLRSRGGRLRFHLAPGWLTGDEEDARKRAFGPWILPLLRLLAKARRHRGRWFDPFRATRDRRDDRALLARFEAIATQLQRGPNQGSLDAARAIVERFGRIRGYGHVRRREERALEAALPALLDAHDRAEAGRDAAA